MKEKSCSEGQMELFCWESCSPAERITAQKHEVQLKTDSYLALKRQKISVLFTCEWGCRYSLWRWWRVGGSGLQEGHVGRKKQLTATALTEENRQKNTGRAALIEGGGHPLKHRVHLDGNEGQLTRHDEKLRARQS